MGRGLCFADEHIVAVTGSALGAFAGMSTLEEEIRCHYCPSQNDRPYRAKTVRANEHYVIHCSISTTVGAKKSC